VLQSVIEHLLGPVPQLVPSAYRNILRCGENGISSHHSSIRVLPPDAAGSEPGCGHGGDGADAAAPLAYGSGGGAAASRSLDRKSEMRSYGSAPLLLKSAK
jgi:hypothetical protein